MRYSREFKIQKVEEFKIKIESHKCYCKSIPNICEEIKIQYETLKKWFKEIERINLNQFCQKCKLKYAKYLLLNTKYKICNIFRLLSFRNVRDFVRWFKDKTGVTPLKYRNTEIAN